MTLRELTRDYPMTRYLIPHTELEVRPVTGYSRCDIVLTLFDQHNKKREIYDILYDCSYYEIFLLTKYDIVLEWFIDAYHEGRRDIKDFFTSLSYEWLESIKSNNVGMEYMRAIITPENEMQFFENVGVCSNPNVWQILGMFATRTLLEHARNHIEDEEMLCMVLFYAHEESERRFNSVMDIITQWYEEDRIYLEFLDISITPYFNDKNTFLTLTSIERRFPGIRQRILEDKEIGKMAKVRLDTIYREDV